MSRKYSVAELRALKDILIEHGNIQYSNNFDIENEFYKKTGIKRSSGPLYMATWRMKKGVYSHLI